MKHNAVFIVQTNKQHLPWKGVIPNKFVKITALILALLLTVASLFSQNKKNPEKNGTIQELVLKGNFEVLLFQSDSEDLYIHAPASVTRSIKSDFKNGIYTITNTHASGPRPKLYLVVAHLKRLKASGNVMIKTPTNLYIEKMNIELSDDASASLYISSDDLSMDVSGSGEVQISGDIDTLRLKTEQNANVNFDIKSKKVYATLKNESEVTFEGDIFHLYAELNQYAILDNLNTTTGTCTIKSNDNSMAKIKAEDFFYLYAGGRSNITFKGNGKTEVMEKEKNATIKNESKLKSMNVKP